MFWWPVLLYRREHDSISNFIAVLLSLKNFTLTWQNLLNWWISLLWTILGLWFTYHNANGDVYCIAALVQYHVEFTLYSLVLTSNFIILTFLIRYFVHFPANNLPHSLTFRLTFFQVKKYAVNLLILTPRLTSQSQPSRTKIALPVLYFGYWFVLSLTIFKCFLPLVVSVIIGNQFETKLQHNWSNSIQLTPYLALNG